MQITHDQLYHVYNRGNNQQRIFYSPQHYFYFIEKMKAHLVPVADMLAWCLMPNHFHFLLQLRSGTAPQHFSSAFRVLLSSYTRGINKERGWTGSIFQQNSKAKALDARKGYPYICFQYIHQNPLRAGLAEDLLYWPYSSYQEYAGKRFFGIVQKALAENLLSIPSQPDAFAQETELLVPDHWRSVL